MCSSDLLDALAPGARLGVVTSRMGSIGARTNASGWLYRASKAAANSVLRDLATVLEGRALCVALHPGWVRTDMGGAGATLAPEQSAQDLRGVLAKVGKKHRGQFINHDGSTIPW